MDKITQSNNSFLNQELLDDNITWLSEFPDARMDVEVALKHYAARDNYGILEYINAEWTFYLHGSHCRFDNLSNGQAVEVKYTEKPEFGCLDGFFFYKYMETTERFKDLANWFVNALNVYNALEVLSAEGTLTKKSGSLSDRCIVAV